MLDRMEQLIREYGMLNPQSKVVCAVSGGADSICLLHGLYRLREKLGSHAECIKTVIKVGYRLEV